LGGGPAEAGRDAALSLVSRGKGYPLLLSGVVTEDIHQTKGEVGVRGERGETEDGANHDFGSGLVVTFTVYMNNPEAWDVAGGGSEGL